MIFDGLSGTVVELKGVVYNVLYALRLFKTLWLKFGTATQMENMIMDRKNLIKEQNGLLNKNGEYSFRTILPGKYLNSDYLPAHIHFSTYRKK